MASVNKVILVGNLGKDPELRTTTGGHSVVGFSIATTEKYPNSQGVQQERTEWHRIVVWGKQAENCAKYLRKGSSVFVEGKLQTRSWDDAQSGQKRYQTEIVGDRIQFLSTARQTDAHESSYAAQIPDFDPSGVPSTLDSIPF